MSNTGWLIVGLITVGAFIGGYALYLVARRKRLAATLRDLDRRS